MDEHKKLNENAIIDCVIDFLVNKPDGNWHVEKIKDKRGHQHGPDLILTGGSHNGERFIIECKGRSYAKSANPINKEGWLNALGQLVTRMNTARTIKTGETRGRINRAYKYGLGLYWVGAQVALRRIPHEIAKTMNLYILSVYDDGFVKQWSPKTLGKSTLLKPSNAQIYSKSQRFIMLFLHESLAFANYSISRYRLISPERIRFAYSNGAL